MKQLFKPILGFLTILVLNLACKKGEMGPQGEKGPAGDVGVAGKNGLTGIKGLTGPTGPQGNAGQNGQNGQNGNYYGYTTAWKDIVWKLDPASDEGLGSTYIYRFDFVEPELYQSRLDNSFFSMIISANRNLLTYKLLPRLAASYRSVGGSSARITYEVFDKKISFSTRISSSKFTGQALQDSLNGDKTKFQFSIISSKL